MYISKIILKLTIFFSLFMVPIFGFTMTQTALVKFNTPATTSEVERINSQIGQLFLNPTQTSGFIITDKDGLFELITNYSVTIDIGNRTSDNDFFFPSVNFNNPDILYTLPNAPRDGFHTFNLFSDGRDEIGAETVLDFTIEDKKIIISESGTQLTYQTKVLSAEYAYIPVMEVGKDYVYRLEDSGNRSPEMFLLVKTEDDSIHLHNYKSLRYSAPYNESNNPYSAHKVIDVQYRKAILYTN